MQKKSFFSLSDGPSRFVVRSILLFTLLGAGALLTACSSSEHSGISTEQNTQTPQTGPAVSDTVPQESLTVSEAAEQTAAAQDVASMPDTTARPEPAQSDTAASNMTDTAASGSSGQISLDAARQTALLDAGLDGSEVTHTKADLDQDDGIFVYEIEFYTAAHDYEYEIDAATGEIRHKEQDAHHAGQNGHRTPGETAAAFSSEGSDIGPEAARSIAAEHAGVSVSEIVFTKAEREYEDGRLIYRIEFRKDRMEYEYEIDAVSGDILKMDLDHDD